MVVSEDGTLTPAIVIITPDGQEMIKMPDGTLSPAVRTPVGKGAQSPVNRGLAQGQTV